MSAISKLSYFREISCRLAQTVAAAHMTAGLCFVSAPPCSFTISRIVPSLQAADSVGTQTGLDHGLGHSNPKGERVRSPVPSLQAADSIGTQTGLQVAQVPEADQPARTIQHNRKKRRTSPTRPKGRPV